MPDNNQTMDFSQLPAGVQTLLFQQRQLQREQQLKTYTKLIKQYIEDYNNSGGNVDPQRYLTLNSIWKDIQLNVMGIPENLIKELPIPKQLNDFDLGRTIINSSFELLDSMLLGILPDSWKLESYNEKEKMIENVAGLLGAFIGIPGTQALKFGKLASGALKLGKAVKEAGKVAETTGEVSKLAKLAEGSKGIVSKFISNPNAVRGAVFGGLYNIGEDLPEGNIGDIFQRAALGGLLGSLVGPKVANTETNNVSLLKNLYKNIFITGQF